MTRYWPDFTAEARSFFQMHMKRPRKLFEAFVARGTGSGRRPGPRDLLWQTVVVASVAALEAGLEDLIFAAHGARQEASGRRVDKGTNSIDANPRKWLVEDRLMAPNAQKIERVLFGDFGVILSELPDSAKFRARHKSWSKGGSGRGHDVDGPLDWRSLTAYIDTMQYIRNAAAHGDISKLGSAPSRCEGLLWLRREDGSWSVQQPHALTALRATVATYNCVVDAVAKRLELPVPTLYSPDRIDYPSAN